MKLSTLTLAVASTLAAAAFASAAPVGVDGSIGADWTGITPTHITYNSAAPTSNFGSPTGSSNVGAYDVYLRAEGPFVYAAVATDAANSPASALPSSNLFANLYFGAGTGASVSSIGFETTNNLTFKPGVTTGGPSGNGSYPVSLSTGYTTATNAATGVVEVAIPISFFATNELALPGFTPGTEYVVLGLSQSLGLSVVGGPAFGPTQLGGVLLPEPTTIAAVAGAGLLGFRRRRA